MVLVASITLLGQVYLSRVAQNFAYPPAAGEPVGEPKHLNTQRPL